MRNCRIIYGAQRYQDHKYPDNWSDNWSLEAIWDSEKCWWSDGSYDGSYVVILDLDTEEYRLFRK